MKQRTLNILKGIKENSEYDTEASDREFATMIHPKKFTGKYTDELKYEQSFEQNCIVLAKFANQPVKTLTTKEYFTLVEFYNKQK